MTAEVLRKCLFAVLLLAFLVGTRLLVGTRAGALLTCLLLLLVFVLSIVNGIETILRWLWRLAGAGARRLQKTRLAVQPQLAAKK